MGKITGTVAGKVALGVAMSASVQAGDGMVNVKSQHSVVQTAEKIRNGFKCLKA